MPKNTKNDHWCTPPELLARVRAVGPIALDPCGNDHDVVEASVCILPAPAVDGDTRRNATAMFCDGLAVDWSGLGDDGVVFVNPPYSDPRPWVEKAVAEADRAVLLLPGATDARWFHALLDCERATVAFSVGRFSFLKEGKRGRANRQGSVLAVLSRDPDDHRRFRDAFAGVATPLRTAALRHDVVVSTRPQLEESPAFEPELRPVTPVPLKISKEQMDEVLREAVVRAGRAASNGDDRRLRAALEERARRMERVLPLGSPVDMAIEIVLGSSELTDALRDAHKKIEELEEEAVDHEKASDEHDAALKKVAELEEELSEAAYQLATVKGAQL